MKYFLAIGMAVIMISALAQGQDDDMPTQDPRVRSKIQAARVAYITDQLALTPEEAEKFWPIYREYSIKRREIRIQLREGRRDADPATASEQMQKDMYNQQLAFKQQELDLERDYSARLLQVISAQKLRSLPDVERRFRHMILEQIQKRRSNGSIK
ncbi:MAG: hypothetical protein WKF87_14270 [Chryseolinea sp.]